jgi:hypothetical protein
MWHHIALERDIVIEIPHSVGHISRRSLSLRRVAGMRPEHRSNGGTRGGESSSPIHCPVSSFRRVPCGGPADYSALSGGCHQFPAVAPCDSGGPASACHMTNQSRRNKPKTLVELESNECRWPIGDPKEPQFHFCGSLQRPGYPYCERHCRIAFTPARPRYQQPVAIGSRSARAA